MSSTHRETNVEVHLIHPTKLVVYEDKVGTNPTVSWATLSTFKHRVYRTKQQHTQTAITFMALPVAVVEQVVMFVAPNPHL